MKYLLSCVIIYIVLELSVTKESTKDEALWRTLLNELKGLEKQLEKHNPESKYEKEEAASVWMDKTDRDYGLWMKKIGVSNWNYITNLTVSNANKNSEVMLHWNAWQSKHIAEAKQYLKHSNRFQNATLKRLLKVLVYSGDTPPSSNQTLVRKMQTLMSDLERIYSTATISREGETFSLNPDLENMMASERDYDLLAWAWQGWRDATGAQMKEKYASLVETMNVAAQENGFPDVGASWRMANYEEDNIEDMVTRLLDDVMPLYKQLHAYVRRKLVKYYSERKLNPRGRIPAHILGDMWSQTFVNIFDIVVPFPESSSLNVTGQLQQQQYDPVRMFETAESFFTSIGLEPMTETFWKKSMLTKPNNRDVVCHGSATDFLGQDDFRIKMCTVVTANDLFTIHHEMGHIEYFMQYRHLANIFKGGANAAFHEAVGDTIGLSVMTTQHLKDIGLLADDQGGNKEKVASHEENPISRTSGDTENAASEQDINFLMKAALEKVAFLPFAYVVDKWRWEVFRGHITPSRYNSMWWKYRETFQGVEPPVPRGINDFDPGAKYHIPASVPYIRYFLSFIGQFQFQKALCKAKGHDGPLHTCDIYRSKEAGDLLKSALKLGRSRPWPDVMKVFTGNTKFSADAILEYFNPLYTWLQKENEDERIGWE